MSFYTDAIIENRLGSCAAPRFPVPIAVVVVLLRPPPTETPALLWIMEGFRLMSKLEEVERPSMVVV